MLQIKTINLITKYYLPTSSIDSESAVDLISELQKRLPDFSFHIIHSLTPYRLITKKSDFPSPGTVHSINPWLTGQRGLFRFLSALGEGFQLVWSARRLNSGVVIVLSNPPLVQLWCGLLLRRTQSWIYWAFDVYPQAFVAAQIVSRQNIIYQFIHSICNRWAPSALLGLGQQQIKFLRSDYPRWATIPAIALPCGIFQTPVADEAPSWYSGDSFIHFCYAGNLGEAHSPDLINELVEWLDPRRHKLIVAIYGSKVDEISASFWMHPAVIKVEFVDRGHLPFVDVHLVTLLEEWTHISIPSKAVSAVCSGGALLFQGSKKSDTWQMFKDCSWRFDSCSDIPAVIREITFNTLKNKRLSASILAEQLWKQRSDAYNALAEFITDLAPRQENKL